jgi:peptide/nickel transport system ATP-binding protein
MDDFALCLVGLRLAFRRKVLLEVPQLRLQSGERTLITGPSGSGKTVLLSVLLGHAPRSRVLAGQFKVHRNGDWQTLDYPAYRAQRWLMEHTAVVFQDAMHSLHPYRSIEAQCGASAEQFAALNLEPGYFLSAAALGTGGAKVHRNAGGPRFAGDCSGGERQRISLLFPFTQTQRRLIVLDEPLTDIDLISKDSVRKALERLIDEEHGRRGTIVLVTHDTSWIAPGSMQHYAIGDADAEGVRRLDHIGMGPPASMTGAETRPASPKPATTGAPVFRLRVRQPFRYTNDAGFRLWPFEALQLRAGEAVGLIGESGSGKSTLLRIAAGLFPRQAYRDQLEIALTGDDGQLQDPMQWSRRRRCGRLQFVSQDSSGALIAEERVERHLRFIRDHKGVDPAVFEQRVNTWAETLRLYRDAASREHFLGLRHRALSMGQKRRYGLLRAFLLLDIYAQADRARPKLLLLDEISRGLDGAALDGLLDILHGFRTEYNVAMLVVSHDMRFVRRACSHLRMTFNGALLPASIHCDSLSAVLPDGAPADPDLNPYYRLFLDSKDLPPSLRVPVAEREQVAIDAYRGCLLRRYIQCPAQIGGATGCIHLKLQQPAPAGGVGICQ